MKKKILLPVLTNEKANGEFLPFIKQITATTPLGRTGQPEDIARVAVFLASDDAAWITGEKISVSGGIYGL